MLSFEVLSAVSSAGPGRTANEDAAYADPRLALVADGVGGAPAGQVASATSAHVICADLSSPFPPGEAAARLRASLQRARASLAVGQREDPARRGMACTLSAVRLDGSRLVILHLGDTRVHLVRDAMARRLTQDHTWVTEMLARGVLRPEQAIGHPYRHVVTRSVAGAAGSSEPDVLVVDARPGDHLLLTSDGVDLGGDHLERVLRGRPAQVARTLVREARVRGSRDDATAVWLEVVDVAPTGGAGRLLGAASDPRNVIGEVGAAMTG
ncbi:PP2C family protein-serine/threonine phosphatase [Nocardioides bruguierae]|uniref:Protein phosphatase 2C domain-containing protein n=1 Tax=Nocardioides bruguierae TaxID=2945102 RepID=A0A9X2D5J2_9ACTN|nr:PP2C family serine/threonine-protein phosphatase [Nocardioides bruguierae]MCM0619399.1 protein phosphatase 2C domain-containing protein [Nocardioides bruguierae]